MHCSQQRFFLSILHTCSVTLGSHTMISWASSLSYVMFATLKPILPFPFRFFADFHIEAFGERKNGDDTLDDQLDEAKLALASSPPLRRSISFSFSRRYSAGLSLVARGFVYISNRWTNRGRGRRGTGIICLAIQKLTCAKRPPTPFEPAAPHSSSSSTLIGEVIMRK